MFITKKKTPHNQRELKKKRAVAPPLLFLRPLIHP